MHRRSCTAGAAAQVWKTHIFVRGREPAWHAPRRESLSLLSWAWSNLPFAHADAISTFQGCSVYRCPWEETPKQRHSVSLLARHEEAWDIHGELSPNSNILLFLKLSPLKKNFFYWSIVDLQHCVSLRYTAKWFSYSYIHSFSYPLVFAPIDNSCLSQLWLLPNSLIYNSIIPLHLLLFPLSWLIIPCHLLVPHGISFWVN